MSFADVRLLPAGATLFQVAKGVPAALKEGESLEPEAQRK